MEKEFFDDTVSRRSRLLRIIASAGIGAAIFAPVAVLNTSTDTEVFPNDVVVDINFGSSDIDVDFGMLGAITLEPDDPVFFGLIGADVKVGGIPNADRLTLDDIRSIDDLKQYYDMYANIGPGIEHGIADIKSDISKNALMGGLAGALVVILMDQLFAKTNWRRKIEEGDRSYVVVGLVLLGILNAPVVLAAEESPEDRSVYIAGFGTIRGNDLVTDFVVDIARQAIDIQADGNTFIDTVEASMDTAVSTYQERNSDQLAGLDFMVTASDEHCNPWTTSAVASWSNKMDARFFVSMGDVTNSGSSVEGFCLDPYRNIDAVKFLSPGNHDSDQTVAQARDAGFNVPENEVIEIDNYTFYGAPDPYRTELGQIANSDRRTLAVERLGEVIANNLVENDQSVTVLMVHDARAGEEASDIGRVQLQLSGHIHQQVGPLVDESGTIFYVAPSINGALPSSERAKILDGMTMQAPLVDTIATGFYLDPKTGEVAYSVQLTIHPDGTTEISDPTPIVKSQILRES